jgi:hypothetical protein
LPFLEKGLSSRINNSIWIIMIWILWNAFIYQIQSSIRSLNWCYFRFLNNLPMSQFQILSLQFQIIVFLMAISLQMFNFQISWLLLERNVLWIVIHYSLFYYQRQFLQLELAVFKIVFLFKICLFLVYLYSNQTVSKGLHFIRSKNILIHFSKNCFWEF